jgi:purine-nucleoside phosphorylase
MTLASPEAEAAAAAIRRQWNKRPAAAVILGTGLGGLARAIDRDVELACRAIPHFPPMTAPAHRGALVCGTLAGVPVAALEGRFHGYEGHRPDQIGFPVRVMAALGARLLIVTSAAGGMHPDYRAGDVVIVTDHVNLTFGNPLVGPHDLDPGLGYPDMSRAYDPQLIAAAAAIARKHDFVAHQGVYVGVLGPNYETRAEYRFFRRLGGDVVGMSTVHEVIVAQQCGLKVLGLSVVTNECRPDALARADSREVEHVAALCEGKVGAILRGVLERMMAGAASEESPGKARG